MITLDFCYCSNDLSIFHCCLLQSDSFLSLICTWLMYGGVDLDLISFSGTVAGIALYTSFFYACK